MSALTVLRNNAAWGPTPVAADEASEACADVAELIEATAALCNAVEFRIDDPRNALRDRVVMAVARVGGAA